MAESKKEFTRRDFLRNSLGATLGVSMAGVMPAGFPRVPFRAPRSSTVFLLRDEKVQTSPGKLDTAILRRMVDDILLKTTGKKGIREAWLSLVKPEDTVGLVDTPHLNPTHPELVAAVKASMMEAGIPGGKITMAQGGPEKVKACTALIAMPGLKAHWLTGIGTVLKLYILYSGNPRNYHHQDSTKLGEIWNLPFVKGKTRLVLVDALYPLCDKGPQPDPRYKWTYNGLIAGTDPVAVETVCLYIITEKRKLLRGEPWPLSPPPLCVEAADKKYGLGTSNMQEIVLEAWGWDKERLV
jgi:hypothetical protein